MKAGKHFYLFLSLVLFIIALPLGDGSVPAKMLLNVFASLVILAGIYTMIGNRWELTAALLIGIPAIGGLFIVFLTPYAKYRLPGMFMWIIFYGYAAVITLKSLLREQQVGREQIFGAISVYLLFGLVWGGVYQFIHIIDQGAFFYDKVNDFDGHLRLTELIYFSFTTITTVGSGDIRPLSMVARSSVILESVFGVIYVAMLIARMIGIYISKSLKQRVTPAKTPE